MKGNHHKVWTLVNIRVFLSIYSAEVFSAAAQ